MNHYYQGNTPDVGGYYFESISRRNPVTLPPYLHGVHSRLSREGHSSFPQRALPSHTNDLIFPTLGQEAAASESGQQFLLDTYPSRYLRPLSAGGWRSSHWQGRSNVAFERSHSLSNAVHVHDRMGSEVGSSRLFLFVL